jgi:hypothetical protein
MEQTVKDHLTYWIKEYIGFIEQSEKRIEGCKSQILREEASIKDYKLIVKEFQKIIDTN